MSGFLPAMLYVPGDDEHKLAKIPTISSPAFILDLEDAVAHSSKPAARLLVRKALETAASLRPLWVRINRVDSGFLLDDLDAIVGPGLAGIVIPKAEHSRDVGLVDSLAATLERRRDLPSGTVRLTAAIETAKGLANIRDVARSSPRLDFLSFGAGDLSLDLQLDWTAESGVANPTMMAAKTQLVIESRIAGLQPPHDGSFPFLDNPAQFRAEVRYARSAGFGGKHAIHPKQLEIICDVFRPTAREVAAARSQLSAFDAAEKAGQARVQVDGKFVDYPVAERARRLIDTAARWSCL
jgi:citrate lyase beta subunit